MRRRVDRILNPWAPWNGEHHPVLKKFPPWQGETDGTWAIDSLGVRTDPRFRNQIRPQPAGSVRTSHPSPHAQYFELVFVLEAVAAASREKPFVMIELGAGYGTWLAIASRAARSLGLAEIRLTGVEMVPQYFAWMKEHLANNGEDPAAHELLHAAASDIDGEAEFQEPVDSSEAYGVSVERRSARLDTASNSNRTTVPSVSLSTLLGKKPLVDLIHCDTQGEEARIFSSCMDLVYQRVSRVLISTHSRRIHEEVRDLLRNAGFAIQYDFGVRSRARTDYGDVQFLDGLLCAVKPAGSGENTA